jgi:hypothetical protein
MPDIKATKERNLHRSEPCSCRDNKCVRAFLKRWRVGHEGEGLLDLFLSERLGPEKIKIDRLAMTEMKRNRRAAIKDEVEPRAGASNGQICF